MLNELRKEISLIGGGPACVSAAVQLKRSGFDILLITNSIGGNIKNANLIENLIGFPRGIDGKQYVKLIEDQLTINKIPILLEEVIKVEKDKGENYSIRTSNSIIISRFLIIGTGTLPIKLGIDGEKIAYQKKKLFYKISEVKNFSKQWKVLIIGSGDAAYDYAMNLSNQVSSLVIIQRSSHSKALPLLQERVKNQSNIDIVSGRIPKLIDVSSNNLNLIINNGDLTETITGDILLVAIGSTPNLSFLTASLKSVERSSSLNPNLFFIGDVKNKNFRQISIALGDGVKTAMKIERKLKESD